jgi:hypothetical protein
MRTRRPFIRWIGHLAESSEATPAANLMQEMGSRAEPAHGMDAINGRGGKLLKKYDVHT